MNLLFLGLTITSAWGNGHATTFRSLCRALASRGHKIRFVEKDVPWYRENRDLPDPSFCEVELYRDWEELLPTLRSSLGRADAVVIGSYFPDGIAAAELVLQEAHCPVLFYDIDTPITMAKLRKEGRCEYLNAQHIAGFHSYLSFTGGPILEEIKLRYHAKSAVPLYCSVDPEVHYLKAGKDKFRCELSYLGTYASDRQPALHRLFTESAAELPERKFLIAGAQYPDELVWPHNVWRIPHVPPDEHASFYSSSQFTLNLTRHEMVQAGYSPSVRLFEAAACESALISDTWPGLECFFTPGRDILIASGTSDVVEALTELSAKEIRELGAAAAARVLPAHTSQHRALEFEAVLQSSRVPAEPKPV